jgi:predicted transcriptional regulator
MTTTTGQRVVQELRREEISKREHVRRVRIDAAQKMIKALLRYGLTQEMIADEIGLHQSVISRYLNGSNPPTIPTLKSLFDLSQRCELKIYRLTNGWREL